MRIRRVVLENVGLYAGRNVFEFTSEKPVILIGGMNGCGKTTFLESVMLALYGENSSAFRKSRFRSYSKYLESLIHAGEKSLTSAVHLEFEIAEQNHTVYSVRREWSFHTGKMVESVRVWENGQQNDFLAKNWTMFVESMLPCALAEFYFFDGEKIVDMALDTSNVQVKNAMKSMLGIKTLDVLQADLRYVERKYNDKTPAISELHILENVRVECEKLDQEMSALSGEIEALDNEVKSKGNKLSELKQQMTISGEKAMKERESLKKKLELIEEELNQNNEELLQMTASELPLSMAQNLILQIKVQAQDEYSEHIMQEATSLIDALLYEFTEQHPALGPACSSFVEYVKKATSGDDQPAIYNISETGLFQLNSLVESVFDEVLTRTTDLLAAKADLEKQRDQINSYLAIDVNENLIKDIKLQVDAITLEYNETKRNLDDYQAKRADLQKQLDVKRKELEEATDRYIKSEQASNRGQRLLKYAHMAQKILGAYTVNLQKRKAHVLSKTIARCFGELSRKDLIQDVLVDPETLNITYANSLGGQIPSDSLSAGEKQLMVVSILWALAICSNQKLPVIIDTPLARLDSAHRASLVQSYFPNVSMQTIILSTDAEIDTRYLGMMQEHVGDTFTLVYHEDEKRTTVKKGYWVDSHDH